MYVFFLADLIPRPRPATDWSIPPKLPRRLPWAACPTHTTTYQQSLMEHRRSRTTSSRIATNRCKPIQSELFTPDCGGAPTSSERCSLSGMESENGKGTAHAVPFSVCQVRTVSDVSGSCIEDSCRCQSSEP